MERSKWLTLGTARSCLRARATRSLCWLNRSLGSYRLMGPAPCIHAGSVEFVPCMSMQAYANPCKILQSYTIMWPGIGRAAGTPQQEVRATKRCCLGHIGPGPWLGMTHADGACRVWCLQDVVFCVLLAELGILGMPGGSKQLAARACCSRACSLAWSASHCMVAREALGGRQAG